MDRRTVIIRVPHLPSETLAFHDNHARDGHERINRGGPSQLYLQSDDSRAKVWRPEAPGRQANQNCTGGAVDPPLSADVLRNYPSPGVELLLAAPATDIRHRGKWTEHRASVESWNRRDR